MEKRSDPNEWGLYFDRFDIVEAYYLFFSDFYDGQWDPFYARSCHMDEYFTPGALGVRWGSLTENARLIYCGLCKRYGFELPEEYSLVEEKE